ncbi:type IX secretion system plug protein [Viscerimonas tarda]
MRGFLFLLAFLFFPCIQGQTYKTEPFSDEIHSIQVYKGGNSLAFPVINLWKAEPVLLSFDRISDNSMDRLRYRIVHCNADWTPSPVSEIDYIDGFNNNLIEDYAPSVNTTIEYTNFQLQIPNNDLRLRLSGNYVVLVYEEDNPGNVLLSACFSVLDSRVAISGNMTSNTLIDNNREHQQLSFAINHKDVNINDPYNDLKVYVQQNGRLDNQKSMLKPSIIQVGRLIYEQNRNLIFEAGNEYRRFETVSHRYNGLRVEGTEYRRPFYYAYVYPDLIRANKRYVYDEDQDGGFYIHNAEVNESSTEADYFYVQFSLKSEEPVLGNVYINGRFTNNTFDDNYLMQYDSDRGEYYISLFLKQGAYNYQYLVKQGNRYSTSPIEGNYYETENEYQVLVYYRPMGQRYDSLIGYLFIGR